MCLWIAVSSLFALENYLNYQHRQSISISFVSILISTTSQLMFRDARKPDEREWYSDVYNCAILHFYLFVLLFACFSPSHCVFWRKKCSLSFHTTGVAIRDTILHGFLHIGITKASQCKRSNDFLWASHCFVRWSKPMPDWSVRFLRLISEV